MKESCPQCEYHFGWRGPRHELEMGPGKLSAISRYFCQQCGIELRHVESRVERAAWFIMTSAQLVVLLGLTLPTSLPRTALFAVAGLMMASFLVGAFCWFRRKHYEITSARQPAVLDRN